MPDYDASSYDGTLATTPGAGGPYSHDEQYTVTVSGDLPWLAVSVARIPNPDDQGTFAPPAAPTLPATPAVGMFWVATASGPGTSGGFILEDGAGFVLEDGAGLVLDEPLAPIEVGQVAAIDSIDPVSGGIVWRILSPRRAELGDVLTAFGPLSNLAGITWATVTWHHARHPQLVVEAALGVGDGGYLILDDPILGRLDTATLGPDLVWSDLSQYVLGCEVRTSSRERILNGFTAGQMSIMLNNVGSRFDPQNLAGPYGGTTLSRLRAGRPVRVGVRWGDKLRWFARAFADFWQPDGDPIATQYTHLMASDGFKLLGGSNRIAKNSSQGAGELAGDRVQRILDDVGWVGGVQIEAGLTTLQASTLAGNTLTELHLVAASEGGALFIGDEGQLVFHGRHRQLVNPRATVSQALFVDGADVEAGELPYKTASVATDDELLVNKTQLGRRNGTVQEVADAESIAVYTDGVARSWGRNDLLCENDVQVASLARFYLKQLKDPEIRVERLLLEPGTDSFAEWATIIDLQLRDRITSRRRPRGMGDQSQDLFVDGITLRHTGTGGELVWQVELLTSSASPFVEYFVLDSATLGVLDQNLLGF